MKTRTHTCDPSILVSLKGTNVFFTYTKLNKEKSFKYPTENSALKFFKQVTAKKLGRPIEHFIPTY